MSGFAIGVIAGFACGVVVGAIVVACLVAGGQADDELERRREQRSTDLGA